MIHNCQYCNYTTTFFTNYKKHIETDKHHTNVIHIKQLEHLKRKEEEIKQM